MDLSVIIVNYNTGKFLYECLQSMFKTTNVQSFEVIVVDNGSEDNSNEMVEKEFPHVILIKNEKNLGFTKANNQGIEIATGKFILLLNSDTLLNENSITPVLEFMRKNPDVGICGCKHLNEDGTLQPSCFHFPSILTLIWDLTLLSRIFPKNRLFGRYAMTYWDYNNTKEVDRVMGSFLMANRIFIEKVGTLDENFFIYEEETDWCYRAKKAGFKVCFFHEATIIHFGGKATKDTFFRVEGIRSMHKFYKKHYGRIQNIALDIIMPVNFILRLLSWTFLNFFKPSDAKRKNINDIRQILKLYLG